MKLRISAVKRIAIHPFWRTLIDQITINSAKNRKRCVDFPVYKDTAPQEL
jgi:hypothetical protein